MRRRLILKQLIAVGGGMVAAGVAAIPAFITAISPALRPRRGQRWQPLGQVEKFPIDEIRPVEVDVPRRDTATGLRVKSVYVWRRDGADAVVYSRNCTDLSCPVTYDTGSECFFCPCHGGIFAKNGERLAGPPNRPLYRYATRVRDGILQIDVNSLPPMT